MPSTYSTNLRFELIGTGEQAGTWGATTNTNIGTLIEQAISGAVTINMSDANLTLTTSNGASDQARNMYLIFTSGVALTTTRTITCPASPKVYVVRNATTGGHSILITAGGAGVTIPNGRTATVACDGTDVRLASDYFATTALDVGSAGAPSYTFAGRTTDGLYSPSANTVGIATNGVERLRATNLGVLLPGGYLSAQPSFRNRIINGDFTIWQRATTQTASGYGSDDRWINGNIGSTKTHSLQLFTLGQTSVPGEPAAFSRTVVTSVAGAGNYVVKQQRIEGVRTAAGQTITISFWAKADTTRAVALDLAQIFGTGGSPSAAVSAIGAQKFTVTSAWQQFTATIAVPSVTGKTLGTNGDDALEVSLWFDAGTSFNARTASLGHQSGTFDIARVQFELGSVATAFEVRPAATELALCQRYYEAGAFVYQGYAAFAGTSDYVFGPTGFRVTKRAAPTVTKSATSFVNCTDQLTDVSVDSFRQTVRTTTTTGFYAGFDWAASAEL